LYTIDRGVSVSNPVPESSGSKTGETPETAEPCQTRSAEPSPEADMPEFWLDLPLKAMCEQGEGSGLRGLEKLWERLFEQWKSPVVFRREREACEGVMAADFSILGREKNNGGGCLRESGG